VHLSFFFSHKRKMWTNSYVEAAFDSSGEGGGEIGKIKRHYRDRLMSRSDIRPGISPVRGLVLEMTFLPFRHAFPCYQCAST